jgi:hypothetical protein
VLLLLLCLSACALALRIPEERKTLSQTILEYRVASNATFAMVFYMPEEHNVRANALQIECRMLPVPPSLYKTQLRVGARLIIAAQVGYWHTNAPG